MNNGSSDEDPITNTAHSMHWNFDEGTGSIVEILLVDIMEH